MGKLRQDAAHTANDEGMRRVNEGDLEGAVDAFRRAADLGYSFASVSLAIALNQSGHKDEAESVLRTAIEAQNEFSAFASSQLGVLRWYRGDLVEAERCFREAALAGEPQGAHDLGRLLNERGDRDGAEAAFRLGMTEGDAASAYQLGLIKIEREDLPAAVEAFQVAARSNEDTWEVGESRAMLEENGFSY